MWFLTKISVTVISSVTWESHHTPRPTVYHSHVTDDDVMTCTCSPCHRRLESHRLILSQRNINIITSYFFRKWWTNSGNINERNLRSDLFHRIITRHPDSKVHGANMGPIWVLSAPDGPQVGPTNLAIRANLGDFILFKTIHYIAWYIAALWGLRYNTRG